MTRRFNISLKRVRPRIGLLFAMWLLLLSGCAQQLDRNTCMSLARGVDYCLAPLQSDVNQSQTQQVSIAVQGERHQLLSQLEIVPQQLTLVGLAPLGQALFTVTYDGHSVSSQQSILLGDQFKAEYLLGLLQLIYWPIEDVNRNLHGGQLRSADCDAAQCRSLYANGSDTPQIEIRYNQQSLWVAKVALSIAQADLTLTINPIAE